MGIRIVYGRAGTGKSKYILDEIKQNLKNQDQKIFIIVPEQFSYATEKKLLDTLGEQASINAEVISFKRLAYRINQEVGEKERNNLTKTGRAMLLKHIVNKNHKDLNFLGKANEIDLILRTITELKKHNVNPIDIQNQIDKLDNKFLRLKLEDIGKIYSIYQNTINSSYIDEDDILTILASQINKSSILDKAIIYIDEFSGFTTQEYKVIEEILKKAEKVTVTICTDELNINNLPENDVFYSNKQTIKKLIEHVKNVNVKVEETIKLDKPYRFKTEELKILEQNIFNTKNYIFSKNINSIHLNLYANPYSEIEETAKKVVELVKTKGIRYRDISIIAKNIDDYMSVVNAIFSKYNIPVFIDSNKALNDNILIKYVLSIFDIFSKNWSKDSVISYVKTGFLELSKQDIYKLENYCNKWQIRGNKWYKEDWKYDSLNKDLESLNNLRKIIVEPLMKFNLHVKNKKTAEEITKSLYEFLEKNEIKNKLNEKLKNVEYENEYISSYNILINILDEISVIFGEQKLTFEEYREILKQGLELSSFGEIPQMTDTVVVGDVERTRSHKVDTIFILGLNDGIYPSIAKDEGFLSDIDREILKQKGIEIAKGSLENLYDEQFDIYKAFTTAENEVYLSYLSADKEGKAARPSILITKIKKVFPNLKEESNVLKEEKQITFANASFTDLLFNLREMQNGEEINKLWASAYNWYANSEKWNSKLSIAIKGFDDKNKAEIISNKNIKRLYGNTLKTSISRLEQYKKCPFSFHLKYGLKLKEKEELKIKPIDTGSFMHDVIDSFFENTQNVKTITEEELEKSVERIINDKLNLSKNYIFTSTPKFVTLTNRLKKVVIQTIKYIVFQIQNSDFNIVGNEIEFKRKIGNVEIAGKIDRLDELNSEEGKYLRIIDYKSSEKNVDLNEFMAGTQIQLVTYLDSSVEQEKALPAGMLYFKMIDPIIKADKNKTEEQIQEELKKKFRMNGIILADVKIIKKMDKTLENGASNSLPVYLDKDGNISSTRSNVITKEQFTILQKKAQKIIMETAKEILNGNIDIKPVYDRRKKEDACKYCEYKSICRFNPKENKYAFIENKTKEEILEELKTEKL